MQKLSKRLTALGNLLTPGNVLCDIACDHGFLSIYAVENGIAPRAIATDLREGPLRAARENIKKAGLSEQIETRLSDGVDKVLPKEAESFVIAGLGGNVMLHILTEGETVFRAAKEMILQPQSEIDRVRRYLFTNGYAPLREDMVKEDGKFYPMMVVAAVSEEMLSLGVSPIEQQGTETEVSVSEVCQMDFTERDLRYGPLLLKERHPVLIEYLLHELSVQKAILSKLPKEEKVRYEEVTGRIAEIEEILGTKPD